MQRITESITIMAFKTAIGNVDIYDVLIIHDLNRSIYMKVKSSLPHSEMLDEILKHARNTENNDAFAQMVATQNILCEKGIIEI